MSDCPASLADRLSEVMVGMRDDLDVSRHTCADGIAYVIHHPVTFQSHRLTPDDYMVFCHIDGKRNLGDIFSQLVTNGLIDENAPDDFYNFVIHLNAIGLLNLPITDGKQLHQRFIERKDAAKKGGLNRYLFFRVPLFSSDAFLDRTHNIFAPMFTRGAALVWLLALLTCVGIVIANAKRFADPLGTLLAADNLVVMWSLLLGLKVVHEFGHAYACKHFGGRVPEMGAYFMMLSPCAYVDASASWGFPSRWQRIIVAMGGMYFESIAAMFALLVWCFTGPGPVHSAAQLVVFLSTVITVGFNMNPLMKYDGYYALSDALGLPHLQSDAVNEFKGVVKKTLFGIEHKTVAATSTGKLAYQLFGFATAVWRVLIMVAIALTISTLVPAVAPFAIVLMFGNMIVKSVGGLVTYLRTSDELAHCRTRAIGITAGLAGLSIVAIASLPVPGGTRAPAVVVAEHEHVIHAASPGFLHAVSTENGKPIAAGSLVCQLVDENLQLVVDRSIERVNELEVTLVNELKRRSPAAGPVQQQLQQAKQELASAKRRLDQMTIVAPADGVVAAADALDVTGRFIQQGEPLATIQSGGWQIEALLEEDTLSDLKPRIGDEASVRLRGYGGQQFAGRIVAIEPVGSDMIQQEQLWQQSGGSIPVMADNGRAQVPYFLIRIAVDAGDSNSLRSGMAAFVRLGSGGGTIANSLIRNATRFFGQLRLN